MDMSARTYCLRSSAEEEATGARQAANSSSRRGMCEQGYGNVGTSRTASAIALSGLLAGEGALEWLQLAAAARLYSFTFNVQLCKCTHWLHVTSQTD